MKLDDEVLDFAEAVLTETINRLIDRFDDDISNEIAWSFACVAAERFRAAGFSEEEFTRILKTLFGEYPTPADISKMN